MDTPGAGAGGGDRDSYDERYWGPHRLGGRDPRALAVWPEELSLGSGQSAGNVAWFPGDGGGMSSSKVGPGGRGQAGRFFCTNWPLN